MRARITVLRHVLRLATGLDSRMVLSIMGLVLLAAGGVAATALSQRWLVDAAGVENLWWVVGAAAVGAVAYAVVAAGGRVQATLQTELVERVEVELNQEVLRLTAQVPTIEHLERPEYLDRLHLLRGETRALAGSCWALAETAAAVVSLGLSVWLLAAVHPALVVLVGLTAAPLFFAYLGRRAVQRSLARTAEPLRYEARLHELCVEAEPAKEVRVSGVGPELDRRASALWRTVIGERVRARLSAAGWQLIGSLCFVSGYVAAIGFVAYQVQRGQLSVGSLVMLLVLGSQLHSQIGAVVDGVTRLGEARHAIDHYLWLTAYAREHSPVGGEAAPERLRDGLALHGVSFRYPGAASDVLRDISVRLPAGAAVAVVGVNGAGKTTLVKLLSGLYQPTRGRVELDGRPLDRVDVASWRSRISPAFQDFMKFQFRVRETVGVGDLPRLGDEAAVRTAVRRANADQVVDRLDAGLDTQLGVIFDGVELSHGQWQQLALARALARDNPLLVVLDEPTAALDPAAEQELFERFIHRATATAAEYGTVRLMVSHRFSTVRSADLILVLDHGRIVEQGSHEELLARDGQYAELFRTQASAYAS